MVEKTNVRLARMEEKFDSLGENLHELVKTIKGNGKAGFIQDVNTKLSEMNSRMDKYEGMVNTIKYLFGGGIFITIIVAVYKLLT